MQNKLELTKARNRIILDAVVEKAKAVCPDSVALIGTYGSDATGDLHEKSDLDLLILIEDEAWWKLAEGFLLQDAQIGYDLYCTTWEALKFDAGCSHANLSKLLDSKLVYVRDPAAKHRLEELQKMARDILASPARREKALGALEEAKKLYADCCLADTLSEIRTLAGGVIHQLLNALMLSRGQYFRLGVKRTFEELDGIELPFSPEEQVMAVIRAESAEEIRGELRVLLKSVSAALADNTPKEQPRPDNVRGTYEEMFSNWRNKMEEAAVRGDVYASYMSMVSCQWMLREIGHGVEIGETDLMASFDSRNLQKNLAAFDNMLESYLEVYRTAGIEPRIYADAEAFASAYMEKYNI